MKTYREKDSLEHRTKRASDYWLDEFAARIEKINFCLAEIDFCLAEIEKICPQVPAETREEEWKHE